MVPAESQPAPAGAPPGPWAVPPRAGDGFGCEVFGQCLQGGGDLGYPGWIVGTECRLEGGGDRGAAYSRHSFGDPARRPNEEAATVGGIGGRLDGTPFAQPGDTGRHLALREARSLGDVADGAVRMFEDVAGHDQDSSVAGGVLGESFGRDGLLT